MTENTIEFSNQDSTWVMRITADRRIEVNEDVEVTEAVKKVLEAMQWMLDKQKRPWVGLTDGEIEVIEALKAPPVHPDFIDCDDWMDFARAIESKLKEKNELR
jgi:hypothetical protein